jgi:hypothetical protein
MSLAKTQFAQKGNKILLAEEGGGMQTDDFRSQETSELAHTVLARACIAVLLQLDEKERLVVLFFPGRHWRETPRVVFAPQT